MELTFHWYAVPAARPLKLYVVSAVDVIIVIKVDEPAGAYCNWYFTAQGTKCHLSNALECVMVPADKLPGAPQAL